MIKPDERFVLISTSSSGTGYRTLWEVLDNDQRKFITVVCENWSDEDDVHSPACEALKRNIDKIGSDVCTITISQDLRFLSCSNEPPEEGGIPDTDVYYPSIQDLKRVETHEPLLRTDLIEIDRLGSCIDLVKYSSSTQAAKRVVFKYWVLDRRTRQAWRELNIYMRLPQDHPNIVPFDKIVLDEVERKVVGWTSLYIAGGTLDQHTLATFPLRWLAELTTVVDDLNLKFGIIHQDIALRNIAYDRNTQKLRLLDFGMAALVGSRWEIPEYNDVDYLILAVYKLITGDTAYDDTHPRKFDIGDIEEKEEWVRRTETQLDHDIYYYRLLLSEWARRRRSPANNVERDESEFIRFEELRSPPVRKSFIDIGNGQKEIAELYNIRTQRAALELAEYTVLWQRPSQTQLRHGQRLLSNGQLMRQQTNLTVSHSGNSEKNETIGLPTPNMRDRISRLRRVHRSRSLP
jgi:hypothetical protein